MRGIDKRLLDLMHARRGHYRLESGHHGDLWLELDGLFVRPARLGEFVGRLADRLAAHRPDAVCGPLTGGAFLAAQVASALDVEFHYSEAVNAPKVDTLFSVTYELPGKPDLSGGRIAVVDDVINAGSAVRSTLTSLEEAGATPVAVGTLLVLGSPAERLASDRGLALESIAQVANTLWAPDDCPLCETGVPMGDLVA